MNRAALEHILRAAAAVTNQRDIVVVGSQALLGQFEALPLLPDRLALARNRFRRLQSAG
jgi:hypothetical protein